MMMARKGICFFFIILYLYHGPVVLAGFKMSAQKSLYISTSHSHQQFEDAVNHQPAQVARHSASHSFTQCYSVTSCLNMEPLMIDTPAFGYVLLVVVLTWMLSFWQVTITVLYMI